VLAQCLSHRHSDAQAPGAGGLGSQRSRNPVDYRQRSTDPYLGRVEADIDPPQAEELSATGPGPESYTWKLWMRGREKEGGVPSRITKSKDAGCSRRGRYA
jgi:hypothetical protein